MGLTCPSCNTEMDHQVEPDVAIDLCPQCGGRFLDQGVLNALVTALPGDIEHRSRVWTDMIYAVEGTSPQAQFPVRQCPRCEDQPMTKVGATCGVDVVLDGCPQCGGFFLDPAELESLNAELDAHAADKRAEEFREDRDGYLVRGNKFFGGTTQVGPFAGIPVKTVCFQVVVYYPEPLKVGLHIFPESWLATLTKSLGFYKGQDIETNDPTFDPSFVIRGDNVMHVRNLLSENVRQALLRFRDDKAAILHVPGSLEVHDRCVAYNEGPYTASNDLSAAIDWKAGGPTAMIDRVLSLARMISEGSRESDAP